MLTLPGRAVGKVVGEDIGDMINRPIDAAGQGYLASYGRDQESDADQVGMRLASDRGPATVAPGHQDQGQDQKAGYRPRG